MASTEDAFDGDVSMGDVAPAVVQQEEVDPTEDAVLSAIWAKQNVRVVCYYPRGYLGKGPRCKGTNANIWYSFRDRRTRLRVLSLQMRIIRSVMRCVISL